MLAVVVAGFTIPAQAQRREITADETLVAGPGENDGILINNANVTADFGSLILNGIIYTGNAGLQASGTLSGNVVVQSSAGPDTLTLEITDDAIWGGNIFLSTDPSTAGDDQITIQAGSTRQRTLNLGSADPFINFGEGDGDLLILDGDGLPLNTDGTPESDFLFLPFVTNLEELRVQGGSIWLLDGNFTGGIELERGFRVLNNGVAQFFSGTIEGNTTIATTGELQVAFGVLDGNVNNSGQLSSTRSFSPLFITGNLRNNAGSATAVAVDPRGSAGTITVGGIATVDGGTLAVQETLEVFPQTVTVTVLTAAGGVTGSGIYTSVTNDFPFLDATVDSSDPNAVTVTLTRNGTGFSGISETDNQRNVGFIWEIAGAAAGSGTDALQLDGVLSGLTDAQLRDTFTSWSGESQAAAPRIATQASRGFGRGLERRSRMMHVILANGDVLPSAQLASSGGLTHDLSLLSAAALAQPGQQPNSFDTFAPGFWVDVLGGDGDIDGDATVAGVDYDYYGLIGGFDWAISNEWIVGLSAGYTTGSYDVSDFSADGDIDTLNIAFYTAFIKDQWRFNSSIGYAFDSYDTQRLVSVPTLGDRIASADFNGGTFSIDGTATYRIDLDNDIKLEPFGTVEYFRSRTDDYAETGAGALSLFVSEGNYEALYTTLGGRIFKTFQMDSTFLTPEARAGWQHEWLDHDTQFDARFLAAGVGAPVRITGADADDDDAALLGVGLTADFNRRFSLRFDYDTRIASNQTDQQFTLALRVPW